jgi:Spy/CpxP family protein refolding chaperone
MSVAAAILVLAAAHADAQGPGRGRGRGGFGRGLGNDLVNLVAMREVREELTIDQEQEQLLDALSADLRDQRRAFRGGFDGPPARPDDDSPREDGRSRLRRLGETGEKLVLAVLEPGQANRLTQLRVQYEGLRAFDREPFVAAMKLTELQKEQIREIRSADRPPSEMEAEVRMSLTESQIAKWDEMKGDSFTFPERPRRFGRRGFRGPPRDDSSE